MSSVRQLVREVLANQSQTSEQADPVLRTRRALAKSDAERLAELELSITGEVRQWAATALQSEGSAA